MSTERQKKGMDGEAPTAKKLREEGETADVDLDAHLTGTVDPTGQVSSGVQTAPLRRTGGERPVGRPDEATRPGHRTGPSPGDSVEEAARDDLTPVTDPQHPERAKNEEE